MEEEWRPVVGFEGTYQVSSSGRIFRGGRELFGTNSHGYWNVSLCANGRKQIEGVHRTVAKAFLPNPARLPLVRHLNDIRDDNRVENLAWGTQSDNMYDAVRNGRNHEANKETCVNGHAFGRVERRQRVCLTCRDISRKQSAERLRKSGLTPDSEVHGTRNGYNTYKCRCVKCLAANADHQRAMKIKRR